MHTEDIINFLKELNENNNREWFAQNKSRYERVRSKFEEISRLLIAEISVFDNDIKNVIDLNLQSEDEVKEELDGFILTESLATHLSDFLDKFTSDMKETGVWLSGFYGSGKSYFAKMLGLIAF